MLFSTAFRHRVIPCGLLALAIVLLSIGLTRCRTTWRDEVHYASGATYWSTHGRIPYLKYPGSLPSVPPAFMSYPLALGSFYRLFGIGLLQTRIFGFLCYLALLAVFQRLLRELGCTWPAAAMGTLLLALDRSLVWVVRSGRPDSFNLLLLAIACWGYTVAVRRRGALIRMLGASWGGAFCGFAVAAHVYTAPAVATVTLVFLGALPWSRAPKRGLVTLFTALVCGLVPLALFACYVLENSQTAQRAVTTGAWYVHSSQGSSVLARFRQEITDRWAQHSSIDPFRWLLLLSAAALLWRRRPKILFVGLAWTLTYFVLLWLAAPKGSWYQVVYVALPLNGLLAFVFDALDRGTGVPRPERARRLENLLATLGMLTLAADFAFLAVYPAAAILQWDIRSHRALEARVAECIPAHCNVMTTPRAFFAVLANDCVAYHIPPPWEDPEQVRRVIAQNRYLILPRGATLKDEFPPAAGQFQLMCTIGQEKPQVLFVKDESYWFDIYRRKW